MGRRATAGGRRKKDAEQCPEYLRGDRTHAERAYDGSRGRRAREKQRAAIVHHLHPDVSDGDQDAVYGYGGQDCACHHLWFFSIEEKQQHWAEDETSARSDKNAVSAGEYAQQDHQYPVEVFQRPSKFNLDCDSSWMILSPGHAGFPRKRE